MIERSVVLNIGTELVTGSVFNSNGRYIGEILDALGVTPVSVESIPDDPIEIGSRIRKYTGSVRWLVITGGLGPTADDITRESLAAALGVELVEVPELVDFLTKRIGENLSKEHLRQASVPEGAAYIMPESGTAPGLRVEKSGTFIYALPGVPEEMKTMFDQAVAPEIHEKAGTPRSVKLRYGFCGLSEVEIQAKLKVLQPAIEDLSLIPNGFEVLLKISVATGDAQSIDDRIREIYGRDIYSRDIESLQSVVGELLRKHGLKVALAESCTGGLASQMLTQIPGSSDYFNGSAVTYSNESKIKLLGVKSETIERFGAVSSECAREMAEGVLDKFGSNIALSITGIAGPGGGTKDKPVGLVWIGVAERSNDEITTETQKYMFGGERQGVRLRAAQAALNILRLKIVKKGIVPL